MKMSSDLYMTKMEPSPLSDDDRRAIAREQWADRRYFAIICALFLANLAAAIMLLRDGLEPFWRIALSILPPLLSVLAAGWWARRVGDYDEREKRITYRAVSFGALGLSGMFTGAAAAWGIQNSEARGLVVLAFCALPLLLLWAAFFNAFLLRNWR
ncbi:MAG TPA: hypothetical protein DCL54_05775 [Alphaproteobacteria bacterium]|nr:hypothetical protein [Alphaproteobacteria bacterium]HAJ46071.1 hypothetical protein [Alphaproteobacteria bacterium]